MNPEHKSNNFKSQKILKIPDDHRKEIIKINSLCQLEGLDCVDGIKRIDLSHNNISDLKCWEKLDGFEEIDLSFNKISDISPLMGLRNMKVLIINGNNVSFDQIEDFKRIRPNIEFNISHVMVGDQKYYFEPRINHDLIKRDIPGIFVRGIQKIDNIEGLGDYDNLYGLGVHGLESFEGIENLTNLKALIVVEGEFKEITGFEALKNLELLVLEQPFTVSSSIKPLTHLHNLRHLILGGYSDIQGTLIEKIEGLENMIKLKTLRMPFCCVKKLEGMENLENLESLNISNNYLSKIEGLDNLKNLNILDLECNEISKIEGLENLQNVNELRLIGNEISKLEGLENLPNLEELFLYGNNLSKISRNSNIYILQYYDSRRNLFPLTI
jgi:internalin A